MAGISLLGTGAPGATGSICVIVHYAEDSLFIHGTESEIREFAKSILESLPETHYQQAVPCDFYANEVRENLKRDRMGS